jgi:hypothetical protein
MSRTATPTEQPSTITRLADRHDDARRFAAEQDKGKTWKTLPGATSVGFMELRGCMCRWPISDPQHEGAIRYCGAARPSETSYCEAHRKIAFAPNRVRGAAPVRPQLTATTPADAA